MPDEFSPEAFKLEAQQVLDELDRRHLLPFKMTAMVVEWIGIDKYTIYLYDSRLPSVTVSWVEGESFRDVFRVAVLDRLSRMK